LAAPNLLEEMNNALVSGKQIICGKKLIKNWSSSRRDSRSFNSNCTALIYTLVDEMGNRARNSLGLAVTMIGTGMMVRADVIKQNNGWPYRSLTEDYQMTADSITKGWSSMYYSYARVYTEEAIDKKTSFKRKVRWIRGHVECKKMYQKAIRKKVFKRKTPFLKCGFCISTIPVNLFFAASVIVLNFGLVALGLNLGGADIGLRAVLWLLIAPFVVIYGSLFIFTLIILIADRRFFKIPLHEKLLVLFFHPFYSFGYLPIYIKANIASPNYFKWEETTRVPFELKSDL